MVHRYKSNGRLVKFPLTGKGKTHFLKGRKKKTSKLQAGHSHLDAHQDHKEDPPGNCANAHGK